MVLEPANKILMASAKTNSSSRCSKELNTSSWSKDLPEVFKRRKLATVLATVLMRAWNLTAAVLNMAATLGGYVKAIVRRDGKYSMSQSDSAAWSKHLWKGALKILSSALASRLKDSPKAICVMRSTVRHL